MPILLGDPSSDIQQVELRMNLGGRMLGEVVWVTGDGIAQTRTAGWIK